MTRRPVYSEFAAHYDALFGSVDSASLDFVHATIPPPAVVLDAGCGTGQYAVAIASRGYTAVAADREPDLIAARPTTSGAVDFVLADLSRLPFTACFDMILARGVLNDLVEPEHLAEALKSLAAALRGDGRFIADVREREAHRAKVTKQPVVERAAGGIVFRASRHMDDENIITSREQFARDGSWSEPYEFRMRTFGEDEVRILWREAGLEVISVERSYGPGSRLTDRLIVVARNGPFGDGERSPARG
jgi:SAM-dependent methyltransferase